ncbi:MAG TPA: AMP-binding protein [Acidimicrobiales bacterium]|nr:AMP-binding protein [Acidimicrobiales bacterium]
MPQLVALAMPPGPRFVYELRRAWDGGDAVLPVDPRLPPAAVERLLDAMAPAIVVDGGGERVGRPGARPAEDGDALVVATSGTTGEPRGVVLTHDAVAASAYATSARLDVDPARDRWLACLPVAHVGGLAVVTRSIVTGVPFDILPGFDAEAVAESRATLVSLVATALQRTSTSHFRAVLLGGAAPPAEVAPNVVVTYGMTETGSGVVYDGVPLDGVEVRITDRTGEIFLRGPMLLRAYRDGADPRTADGWFRTGDAGAFDAMGRLRVHGRLSELIITGGENVWPTAVEAALRPHRSVADVVVRGEPDEEWGAVVTAEIVLDRGASEPSLDELRRFARVVLPGYALPRRVRFVAAIDRTASGKVRRPAAGPA